VVGEELAYEEFNPDGKLKQGQVKKGNQKEEIVSNKSRYEEDVFRNGHTSVWGSYWHRHFGWGYQCCFSFDRDGEECKGVEGKKETIKREYEWEQE